MHNMCVLCSAVSVLHPRAIHEQVGLQGVFDVLDMHIPVLDRHQQFLHWGRQSLRLRGQGAFEHVEGQAGDGVASASRKECACERGRRRCTTDM